MYLLLRHWSYFYAFYSGKAPSAYGNWSARGISNNKLVYWGESHDTWSNNKDWGYSNDMSQNVIDRAYAVAASRNDISALYFSRPSSKNKESIYAGQKYKFTIDEIFEAVNYYVETKEEWREWKDFSTLMNQIPDFVEGAKERDK